MYRSRFLSALSLAFALTWLAGCAGPRTVRLAEHNFPKLPADGQVDVYLGSLDPPFEPVAVIESEAYPYVDDATKRRQLEQLKARARDLGANAVHDLRMLPRTLRSYKIDEDVPFLAVKQGTYDVYFLRGVAVRQSEREPAAIEDVRPSVGWAVEKVEVPPVRQTGALAGTDAEARVRRVRAN